MPASLNPDVFESWLHLTPAGLYCAPADIHIDPHHAVDRAIITHGHADHARPGHGAVLATPETIAIMKTRMGEDCAGSFQSLSLGEVQRIGDVDVHLAPAGHVLGSAQIVLEYRGRTAVVSGDYKRQTDPTCAAFEVVPCDLFITEATFGLPVFKHEDAAGEVQKLLRSLADFPDRTHLVGVYGLGKCQRLIRHIREAGYDRTIWLHGAMVNVTKLYQELGIDLGDCQHVSEATDKLPGEIVMCPPSALQDRWSRRLTDPVTIFASGWMRVRGRARQRGVELPLIVSDHVDWPDLLQTIQETGAHEVWVTHGREDALVHQLGLMGLKGRALRLVGRDEEEAA
ncbi:MAG: ligase-associated DNA damage response exonuclease [Pseudomonadota bacterium]